MELYLNFVKPNYGKILISEPEGFDAFSFNITQQTNRFGRDKSIGAKEIDLEFWDGYRFDKLPDDEYQVTLNGTIVDELSQGLELILQALKEHGSEVQIFFITSENGEDFVNGQLDIPEAKTDDLTYFKCNVVQDTKKALIERKKEIKADVFATTDTFGNPMIPAVKEKILLKAQPIFQTSKFKFNYDAPKSFSIAGTETKNDSFNLSATVVSDGIEDTLSFLYERSNSKSFSYIEAVDELTNVQISITNLDVKKLNNTNDTSFIIVKSAPDDFNTATKTVLQTLVSAGSFNSGFTFDYPLVRRGERIWLYFKQVSDGSGAASTFYTYTSMDVEISATATAIDTIINGVDYFKFWKKGVESLSGLNFESEILESGELSKQCVANGNMIRLIDGKPLNFVFKDEANDLREFNMDYQISEGLIVAKTYDQFYPNIELGVIDQPASEDFLKKFNTRFKILPIDYGYKTYAQDKDESNTSKAFNTEIQLQSPNEAVEGKLEVSINHIRDTFSFREATKEANVDNKALVNDDKIFILDVVNIPPGTQGGFTAFLNMLVETVGGLTTLKIASTKFSWELLGFTLGNTFTIVGDENIGNYTVLAFDSKVLTLLPIDVIPDFTGITSVTVSYPLTGVSLKNREFEGFTDVVGLDGGVSNLKYSIGRNLNRYAWSSYLATIGKDVPNGVFRMTNPPVNSELQSRFLDGDLIVESANIPVSSLTTKILDKYEYSDTVPCSFAQAKSIIENTVNIGGYYRVFDKNGKVLRLHFKDLDSFWSDGTLTYIGESRNESDFLSIVTTTLGFVTITEIGYDKDIDVNLEWYKITGDYVQIFDNDNLPLINLTKYTKISINGVVYNDVILFANALSDLTINP